MRKLFVGIVAAALLALGAAPALAAPTIYPQSNAGPPTVGAMVTVGLTITEYVEVAFGEPNHNLVMDSFSPGASAITSGSILVTSPGTWPRRTVHWRMPTIRAVGQRPTAVKTACCLVPLVNTVTSRTSYSNSGRW